ncbi:MAG: xylulokinase [Planctomycetota bacterium]|nr:xylulokinase [Planctomycetota bacterium]
MALYIGLDLGTSELKAAIIDRERRFLATAGFPLEVDRPRPLWAEQDPDLWWRAVLDVMDRLAAKHPEYMKNVHGIGLSGQMHGAVLLGGRDEILRPAILWCDGRSERECAELVRREPRLSEISGNLAMPGFTAPKLLWVAGNEPEAFARTRCVLLPKDWLRLKLTGEKKSDMSDAAGTLWLDVGKRAWSGDLLAACGLTEGHMPGLVEGSDRSGILAPGLARRWRLGEGVAVAGGAGDNAASAVGIGAINPGDGFVSLGTSGVLFVCNDRFRPNPERAVHAFCHALPGRWHQMSVMLSAASCLRWIAALTRRSSEKEMLAEVAALPAADRMRAPLFLPYLSGERSPHNNPHAKGVFFGMEAGHGAADLGYAVLEGVAFGMRDGLAALQSAGAGVDRLSLVGGGARSAEWAGLLASALGVEITTHAGSEASGALGAACLARLAVEGMAHAGEICPRPPAAAVYRPERTLRDRLDRRYALFEKLYRDLEGDFSWLDGGRNRLAARKG